MLMLVVCTPGQEREMYIPVTAYRIRQESGPTEINLQNTSDQSNLNCFLMYVDMQSSFG